MTFEEWTALMTQRLLRRFPRLSVLERDPGICYVLGISAIDMVEVYGGCAMLMPHKDPLRMVDGVLFSRHKGRTLERRVFALDDEHFVMALRAIQEHLAPSSEP